MASKSKRRRRVLGASCILAALIVAGSSFAWFTSKDEVTNRLTANADYGVSIVESFVPPKNMIPGQTVNKDVYAVNTGTIDAFVKETVTGNLTYTYEKRVDAAPTATSTDYVELDANVVRSIDGATSQEAGGYLVWTNAKDPSDSTKPAIAPGPVNSATVTDADESTGTNPANNPGQVEGTRWTPPATGIYIFRRSFVPAQTGWVEDDSALDEAGKIANAAKAPYFTYAGYYYVKGAKEDGSEDKYYKIVIGSDAFRAAKESVNATTGLADWEFDISVSEKDIGANVAVDRETGELTGDVIVKYVKNITKTNVSPTFTYHATGSDADPTTAYLTAYYTDTDNNSDSSAAYTAAQGALTTAEGNAATAASNLIDAQREAAQTEVAYENDLGAYNTAVSRYNQALADWTYADALTKASTKLINAAKDRGDAEKAKDDDYDEMKAALKALKDEIDNLENGSGNAATTDNTTGTFGNLLDFGDSTDISYASIFQTPQPSSSDPTLEHTILSGAAGNAGNQPLMQEAKNYMNKMEEIWSTRTADKGGNIVAASARLKAALADFENLSIDYEGDDAARAQAMLDELYAARKELEDLLKEYKQQYATLQRQAESETALTELANDENAIAAKIDNWLTELDNLKARIEVNKNQTAAIAAGTFTAGYGADADVQDYIKKYNDYIKQINETIPAADAAWMKAVNTYNNEVGNITYTDAGETKKGAKLAYTEAIHTDQRVKDINGNYSKNDYEGLVTTGTALVEGTTDVYQWWLTDDGTKLVNIYSVEQHNSDDPTLTTTTDGDLAVLWKTIGKDTTLDESDGSGYVGDGDASTEEKTTEAIYKRKGVEYGDPAVEADANTYTKAVNAIAAPKNTFKTLIQNTHAGATEYATVQALESLVTSTADGSLSKKLSTSQAAYDEDMTELKNARAADAAAKETVKNAQKDVDAAAGKDESAISFTIYLDDPNDAGQLMWTSELAEGESAQSASFYYNKILGAGETSDKLIDAVKLDSTVKSKDYKSLVFDLNVALDSAQITYANDQRTITSESVTANDAFTKKVSEINQTTKAVTWEGTEALADNRTFRVGLTNVTPVEPDEAVSFTTGAGTEADPTVTHTYKYKITVGGIDYYGNSLDNGATFVQLNAGLTGFADPAKSVTLTVGTKTATP